MMRPRINDYNNGYNHHQHHNNHNQHQHQHQHHSVIPNKGKQLMSFQNYVRTLNNSIDENAAFKKYKDFMANLSQSKVGRFFDANKDREWFRFKYHPVESQKTLSFQIEAHQKRLHIFNELNQRNYFDKLPFVITHSPCILNLLDAISIHLSSGPHEVVERLLLSSQNIQDSDTDSPDLSQQRLKYIPNTPSSVFIDDISIETTIAELRDICTQANSNLQRITALDPYYVEGGHLRRKFLVIYDHSVDIKDVCWKLSRMKLDGKLLNVYINKCLSKRIHTVDGITNHHICLVNDIRNAIKLILNFDELKGLNRNKEVTFGNETHESMDTSENVKPEPDHDTSMESVDDVAPLSPPGSEKSNKEDEDEKPFDVSTLDEELEKEKKKVYEFKFNIDLSLHELVTMINRSSNPLLQGALNYLIEFVESSCQNYQITKVPTQLQQDPKEINLDSTDIYQILDLIVRNLPYSAEECRIYLDKLLWYLRIVHSYDYYKKVVYKQEDELTLRMGVLHVRDNPIYMPDDVDEEGIKNYLKQSLQDLQEFAVSQSQKYITKDEERFNYKSYGKVITDELASYSQRIQKPKSTEVEEVYKCKHCTKVFQKMSDIGRHFIGKHRWAIDAIELETDFFNAYLFDQNKINPCPPKELLEVPANKYVRLTNFSQMGEDPDLLQEAIKAYSKMESFVREPAPRAQVETDPRNDSIVDYGDISFEDAI